MGRLCPRWLWVFLPCCSLLVMASACQRPSQPSEADDESVVTNIAQTVVAEAEATRQGDAERTSIAATVWAEANATQTAIAQVPSPSPTHAPPTPTPTPTPTATTTSTPTPTSSIYNDDPNRPLTDRFGAVTIPSDWENFTSPRTGASFRYPPSWNLDAATRVYLLSSPYPRFDIGIVNAQPPDEIGSLSPDNLREFWQEALLEPGVDAHSEVLVEGVWEHDVRDSVYAIVYATDDYGNKMTYLLVARPMMDDNYLMMITHYAGHRPPRKDMLIQIRRIEQSVMY